MFVIQKRLIDDTEDSSKMKRDGVVGQSNERQQKDVVDNSQTGSDVKRADDAAETVATGDDDKHHLHHRVMKVGVDDVAQKEATRRCVGSACRRRLQRRDVAKQQQQQLDQHHQVAFFSFCLFVHVLTLENNSSGYFS